MHHRKRRGWEGEVIGGRGEGNGREERRKGFD